MPCFREAVRQKESRALQGRLDLMEMTVPQVYRVVPEQPALPALPVLVPQVLRARRVQVAAVAGQLVPRELLVPRGQQVLQAVAAAQLEQQGLRVQQARQAVVEVPRDLPVQQVPVVLALPDLLGQQVQEQWALRVRQASQVLQAV